MLRRRRRDVQRPSPQVFSRSVERFLPRPHLDFQFCRGKSGCHRLSFFHKTGSVLFGQECQTRPGPRSCHNLEGPIGLQQAPFSNAISRARSRCFSLKTGCRMQMPCRCCLMGHTYKSPASTFAVCSCSTKRRRPASPHFPQVDFVISVNFRSAISSHTSPGRGRGV